MSKRTDLLVLTFACCVFASPARAADVSGFGNIDTNLDDPEFISIVTDYEDPEFLDVRKIVQLTPDQVGGTGSKTLDHLGEAQFGRLRARSYLAGSVPLMPELSSGVASGMGFEDQFTLVNLGATNIYLRFDVELSGEMTRGDATSGNLAVADFGISMTTLAGGLGRCLTGFGFFWAGDQFSITSECAIDGNRFVAYPDEEPRFEQSLIPGPPSHSFRARGHLDVPLDGQEFDEFAFGDPFQLRVVARAQSSCGTEPCFSITDFFSARIYNARFVDASGDPVAGPTFTTESGYDYVTAVPEPDAFAMGLVVLGALFATASRRTNIAPREP